MIKSKWLGSTCIVAATGPSLTEDVARQCEIAHSRGIKVAVVNDAYKLMPFADLLYAADYRWWIVHKGCESFAGERWSSWQNNNERIYWNEKINYIRVKHASFFSLDPKVIHGFNSGFQLINIVLLLGANPIILVGFDMRVVSGKRHFFGDHPPELDSNSSYDGWVPSFIEAARTLPRSIRIINATPDSAIKCFEMMPLSEALQ